MFCYYIIRRADASVFSVFHLWIGGAAQWQSAIFAARVLRSASRSLILTDVQTECGSPMLSVSRRLSTVLRAMYTSVQDVSVPTRLNAPSDLTVHRKTGRNACLFLFPAVSENVQGDKSEFVGDDAHIVPFRNRTALLDVSLRGRLRPWQSVPCRFCKHLFSCKAPSYFAVGATLAVARRRRRNDTKVCHSDAVCLRRPGFLILRKKPGKERAFDDTVTFLSSIPALPHFALALLHPKTLIGGKTAFSSENIQD